MQLDCWNQILHFNLKSKDSDPFVYALVRKEAYLQNKWMSQNRQQYNKIDIWILMALRYALNNKMLFSPLSREALSTGTSNTPLVIDLQGVFFGAPWSWQLALDFPSAIIYGYAMKQSLMKDYMDLQMRELKNKTSPESEEESDATDIYLNASGSNPSVHTLQSTRSPDTALTSTPNSTHTPGPVTGKQSYFSEPVKCVHQRTIGPSNYVPCEGYSLRMMPFDDNTFDVVSARCFWSLVPENEWHDVFVELLRILKPGGYIEIVIFEHYPLNGDNVVESWWERLREGIRKVGLQPDVGVRIPNHLYKAGFDNVQRSFLALPRGWDGQFGHVSEFLSVYYAEAMFGTLSDLNLEEIEAFKLSAKEAVERGEFPGNSLCLMHASKPKTSAKI